MSNNSCTCFEPIWHEGKCTLCGGIDKTPITPTQLPDEVVRRIWREAEGYAEDKVKAINEEHFSVYNAYIAGATEYATKLQLEKDDNQVNLQEITNLSNLVKEKDERIRLLTKACGEFDKENQDNYRGRKEARALLEKFISRHESGLLPDRFIYNEIKQYLNGTK
jgi:hypothetical protein